VKWYRKAAEQGDADAQYNLGVIYMWSSLAKTQGNEIVADNLDIIKGGMTADQIAEAQRLATEWWEEHQ